VRCGNDRLLGRSADGRFRRVQDANKFAVALPVISDDKRWMVGVGALSCAAGRVTVMPVEPVAFMSYARFDDQHDDGQLTQFRERLSAEVRAQIGDDFPIFQDRDDIAWGQNWQQRIDQALDAVTLLIVILTPGFLRSSACRAEVERFLAREGELGRQDLILPVYYIGAPELDEPGRRGADPLAQLLASRQFADWRELRFEPFTSPVVRKALAQLATRMRDTFWRSPLSKPASSDDSLPPQPRRDIAADRIARQSPDKGPIPAPLVLVGNPRLGSTPAALPQMSEPAPDSVLDGGTLPGIVVRAASLRGDDHRYQGETRQDSFGLWALAPPTGLDADVSVLLACVADGLGSKRLSQLGSARACSLLHQYVTTHFAELVDPGANVPQSCHHVMTEVASGLQALAADLQVHPDEVATTLAAALVIMKLGEPRPSARAILFGVGDSTSFLLRRDSWHNLTAQPTADGQLSNATGFLPARPERCAVSESTLREGDMLMTCTDGLAMPLEYNKSVGDQFAAWWGTGHVPSLPEFYWQMSFRAQTFGDDRTVVCMWINAGK
jgi:hypothetical protein